MVDGGPRPARARQHARRRRAGMDPRSPHGRVGAVEPGTHRRGPGGLGTARWPLRLVARRDRRRAGPAGRGVCRRDPRTDPAGSPGRVAHRARVPPEPDRRRRGGGGRLPGLCRRRRRGSTPLVGHIVPERGRPPVSQDRRALRGRVARVRPARRAGRHPASGASRPGRRHGGGAGRLRRCRVEPRT